MKYDYLGMKAYNILFWSNSNFRDLSNAVARVAKQFSIEDNFIINVSSFSNMYKHLKDKAKDLSTLADSDGCYFENIILLAHGSIDVIAVGGDRLSSGSSQRFGNRIKPYLQVDGSLYLIACKFGGSEFALKGIQSAMNKSNTVVAYDGTIQINDNGMVTIGIGDPAFSPGLVHKNQLSTKKIVAKSHGITKESLVSTAHKPLNDPWVAIDPNIVHFNY